MDEQPQEAVVLVHGLWMKPWTWGTYRRFLTEHGFKVYLFGYKTTQQAFDLTLMQLTAYVNSRPEATVHLVGHSMGGVLSMRALPRIKKLGKLLMLGSPVNGSRVVKKLKKMGWDDAILKRAAEPLAEGVKVPVESRMTMMIAGTSAYGLSRFVEWRFGVSDGTVGLAETQADWIDQHEKVHSSHFGLLRNKSALKLTLDFLSAN